LVLAGGDGKPRVFLGAAAAGKRRKLAREMDRAIERALRGGDLGDSEIANLERLAALADRLARGED
jgi:hypothetical protein